MSEMLENTAPGSGESLPRVAQPASYSAQVEAGKTYFWCSCGLSAKQPFCDGAHKGTGMKSVRYVAEETGTVYFCGCKKTTAQPMCDGTHAQL